MVRVTLIGAGAHSRNHGGSLKHIRNARPDQVELVAVCDLDLDRARAYAELFGFERAYDSIAAMLKKEKPDCVIAIVPIPKTLEVGGELLETGIPVVLEKTPGLDSTETRELLGIAREHRAPHMVSFNRRFIPGLVRAREWLASNGDRPPKLVHARMLRNRRREPQFAVGTGIHLIDAVLSLLGAPKRVVSWKLPTIYESVYLYAAQIFTRNDDVGQFTISPVVGRKEETYEIHGEDYCIFIDAFASSIRVFDEGAEVLTWAPPDGSPEYLLNGTLGETEAFLAAVEAGGPFAPGLGESLLSMLAAEAVLKGGETEIEAE